MYVHWVVLLLLSREGKCDFFISYCFVFNDFVFPDRFSAMCALELSKPNEHMMSIVATLPSAPAAVGGERCPGRTEGQELLGAIFWGQKCS